jgi:hypothetical protein
MKRANPVLSGFVLLVALTAAVCSAKFDGRRPEKVGRWPRLSLLKVEKGAITVKESRGDDKAGPREYRLATDGATTVRVGLRLGTLADLKAGQWVVVTAVDGVAKEIHIARQYPAEKPPEKK